MPDLWIRNSGTVRADDLPLQADESRTPFFVALLTDGMLSGRTAYLGELESRRKQLLELRVFGENEETWYHRTMTGDPFRWRTADDEILKRNAEGCGDRFLSDPDHTALREVQMLDMDDQQTPCAGEPRIRGNRLIRSGSGGIYELPAGDGNGIEIVRYLRYTEDGTAAMADFRLRGFVKLTVS